MIQVVSIKTERGSFKFVLLEADAPQTVKNFVSLAREGFYRNLTFHRVIPGVLIQGGDPTGTGTGGPGYAIKGEFSSRAHVPGTVAMARTQDPDSAGSQFYVCRKELPHLNGHYAVFGQVIEGQDTVDAIQAGDRMLEVEVETVSRDDIPAGILP